MTTLQNPGDCPECGRTRTAAVSVYAGGDHVPSVFCRYHSVHPCANGPVLVIMLDADRSFSMWVQPRARFGDDVITGMLRASMDLTRAHRQRIAEDDRIVAGPWRVIVEGEQVFAPRSPRSTQAAPWPMYASRLRGSRWSRKCVQCGAVLDSGVKVYRARKADRSTGPCPWRDSSAIRDCIVCEPCVDVARKDLEVACATVAGVLADLLRNTPAT